MVILAYIRILSYTYLHAYAEAVWQEVNQQDGRGGGRHLHLIVNKTQYTAGKITEYIIPFKIINSFTFTSIFAYHMVSTVSSLQVI